MTDEQRIEALRFATSLAARIATARRLDSAIVGDIQALMETLQIDSISVDDNSATIARDARDARRGK